MHLREISDDGQQIRWFDTYVEAAQIISEIEEMVPVVMTTSDQYWSEEIL